MSIAWNVYAVELGYYYYYYYYYYYWNLVFPCYPFLYG
jgi:hypothetical protein